MAVEIPNKVIATGSVTSAGTEIYGDGAKGAQTGTGTYTVTLDRPVDSTAMVLMLTARQNTFACCTYVHTSATVKTVTTFDAAGNAVNAAFDYAGFQRSGT